MSRNSSMRVATESRIEAAAPVEITPGRGYVMSSGSIDLLQAVGPSKSA